MNAGDQERSRPSPSCWLPAVPRPRRWINPAARISVDFIEPEKFTDARRAELEPTSAAVVGELQKVLTAGAR